jgi:hypothetical protein
MSAADVGARLAVVRRRIADAGGDPDTVRIVAVTKGFGADAVADALANGLCDIGENYAQELVAKERQVRAVLPAATIRWHFLGAVQRNKVRALAPLVDCWQGVCRAAEGAEIARRRPGAAVLVEVDVTDEPGRNGCPPGEVPALVAGLRGEGLDVRGLMVVAPPAPEGAARAAFAAVRALADRCGLPERSMGMSGDLEAAVAEGTTMVRIGRALFGDRPPRSRDRRPVPPGTAAPGGTEGDRGVTGG